MAFRLAVIAGPDKGLVFPLPDGAAVTLGRGGQTVARLADPHVSRVHCRLAPCGDALLLSDAGSTTGTFVNGQRVVAEYPLRDGDVIAAGQTQLRVEHSGLADQPTLALPPSAATMPPAVVPAPPPPAPAAAPPPAPVRAPPAPAGSSVVQLADLYGQVFDHYRIGGVRARGQSGLVFRARDLTSGRDVALKVLRPEFTQRAEDVQRFFRAAQTVVPLRHPNLVPLYEAGQTGPYCWLAMEYVEGESLTDVINRIGVAGMLDWRFAARVAVHVGRALAHAHAQQIIHRNLTPQNVLVRFPDRSALLGDLLLAKALEGALAQQITHAGEILGDVRYMSPERLTGRPPPDARSDLYSLGALVYALLTGRPPLQGKSLLETLALIPTAEPVRPKKFQLSIADQFEGVVMRLLAKRPEERYQSADELLAHLERALKYQGVKL
jgi:hypothetical protein